MHAWLPGPPLLLPLLPQRPPPVLLLVLLLLLLLQTHMNCLHKAEEPNPLETA